MLSNCYNLDMRSLILAFAGCLFCLVSHSQPLPQLKNVVVILADDHALKVTGAYGNQIINTPSIDQLSSEGVTYTSAYCNAPICSASRQSLLTGKYPHATGVNLLFTPFSDDGNITIAEHLREMEYQTALIGKSHWNNWVWSSLYEEGPPNHGFDQIIDQSSYRKFLEENPPPAAPSDLQYYSRDNITKDSVAAWMNYQVRPHKIDDAHSSGTFYANQALEFIEQNRNEPFFLWLAFFEPHQPYYFPYEYAGKYKPEDMLLGQGSPEDDRWIPLQYKNLEESEKRGIIASYYTSTEYMDKNLGLVLDGLKRMNLEDNTLVLYISDNGYLLYEHKRFEKHTMWEESIRQPLIVKAGKQFRSGSRHDALVEYVDIVPTILELIKVKPMAEAQGSSFAGTLIGEADHKSLAFSTYLHDNLAMVCDKKWKYVFTTGSRDLGIGYRTGLGPAGITHRLYDLENDPQEHHSVAHLEQNQMVLEQMKQKMLDRFFDTHPDSNSCPEDLSIEGKLVWFCEPRDVGADPMLDAIPIRVFSAE